MSMHPDCRSIQVGPCVFYLLLKDPPTAILSGLPQGLSLLDIEEVPAVVLDQVSSLL